MRFDNLILAKRDLILAELKKLNPAYRQAGAEDAEEMS